MRHVTVLLAAVALVALQAAPPAAAEPYCDGGTSVCFDEYRHEDGEGSCDGGDPAYEARRSYVARLDHAGTHHALNVTSACSADNGTEPDSRGRSLNATYQIEADGDDDGPGRVHVAWWAHEGPGGDACVIAAAADGLPHAPDVRHETPCPERAEPPQRLPRMQPIGSSRSDAS